MSRVPPGRKKFRDNPVVLPKYFLWTKIGTESGESLGAIIRRKEVERAACDGIFFWGVGNSVGTSLSTLKRLTEKGSAVFSRMRSRAKAADAEPSRLLIWLSYEGTDGNSHPLPTYSFVTSRDSGHLADSRRAHYALVCESSIGIDEEPVGELDASALVNLRSGKPVGYSQVTSVVARNGSTDADPMTYPVTFTADLVGPGQVRLADPVEISAEDVARVAATAKKGSLVEWKRAVVAAKKKVLGTSSIERPVKVYSAQLDMLESA